MRLTHWAAGVLGAALLATQALVGQTGKPAQAPASVILDDLVVANRILANENILDGLGHISARSLQRPDHFFLSRDLAPGLVTAADLVEYDLDGNPVNAKAPQGYRERYIHAAVFKARPDVKSVVHSHMPSVLPFTDSTVALRPMYHMAAFLVPGVPMFEIRKVQGQVGMLIDNNKVAAALAETLGNKTVALMRGHGAVIVGSSIPDAVSSAIFLDVNARVQAQTIALGGGTISYLTQADLAPPTPNQQPTAEPGAPGYYPRSWGIWKQNAMKK
ncbi:MAG TPA: class II aldolase/adducin family protein [Vicinamibacterales bacterium]|jgi:HCOMODA/2-hydroxy-3-carboxy-muconic semialdehyde decarboxylase